MLFEPINNHNPALRWPFLAGFGVLALFVAILLHVRTDIRLLDPSKSHRLIADSHVIYLIRPQHPAVSSGVQKRNGKSPREVVTTLGSARFRQLVEHGRNLSFDIVAEESLPVLRANGVSLAFDTRRPRGNTLLYDLRTGTLVYGAVPSEAVVREVEGLPADFDAPSQEASRILGHAPHVWALYSPELFAVLRSLTEDALKEKHVPIDAVKLARVRLTLAGGHAFFIKLVSFS